MKVAEDCIEALKQVSLDEVIHVAKILRLADRHRETAVKIAAAVKAENRKQQKVQNDNVSKGVKSIGRKIDQQVAPPLRFVKRRQMHRRGCGGGHHD